MSRSPACANSTDGAPRGLYSQEIGQIAGRAGRFRRDGAFGVTGDAPDLDPEIVGASRGPCFPGGQAAEWRNASSISRRFQNFMRSLAAPPPDAGSPPVGGGAGRDRRCASSPTDELVVRRTPRPRQSEAAVGSLPDAGLPQDHAGGAHAPDRRPVRASDPGRPAACPRTGCRASSPRSTGPTATSTRCQARLARVRTLAYIANRADWLADPAGWQGRARALEDRLSDTLHQSLMQRFVDRRTSTLLRSLAPARRPDPRRHRRRRRGDGRGPRRRPPHGRPFRAGARRHGAGGPGASRRRRAGGRARGRAPARRTRGRGRRGFCARRGRDGRVARRSPRARSSAGSRSSRACA